MFLKINLLLKWGIQVCSRVGHIVRNPYVCAGSFISFIEKSGEISTFSYTKVLDVISCRINVNSVIHCGNDTTLATGKYLGPLVFM
jgi:hypothetical protein